MFEPILNIQSLLERGEISLNNNIHKYFVFQEEIDISIDKIGQKLLSVIT